MVPNETKPVSGGAKVTTAPGIGLKMLFGVVELYNCAVIVRVDPKSVNAAVVLKYADIDVIVPSRGIENAKLSSVPPAPFTAIKSVDTI